MNIAILSDIHAGLGADNKGLRKLQTTAVQRATSYLSDQDIDTLVLNGDTTDHLLNSLSLGTSREVALEVLAPLVALIKERRSTMKTLVLPGNTDWPVADSDPSNQDAFFVFTGLTRGDAHLPSNLWKSFETDDTIISITHGHALKPANWPLSVVTRRDKQRKLAPKSQIQIPQPCFYWST
jgi:3',5'-cyclic AMP phosphodiesterase CpdA